MTTNTTDDQAPPATPPTEMELATQDVQRAMELAFPEVPSATVSQYMSSASVALKAALDTAETIHGLQDAPASRRARLRWIALANMATIYASPIQLQDVHLTNILQAFARFLKHQEKKSAAPSPK